MIRRLTLNDLPDINILRNRYFSEEDPHYNILSYFSPERLVDILENDYIFGKYIDNELIGMVACFYNQFDVILQTYTSEEEIAKKKLLFSENNFNENNVVVFSSDLIGIEHRGKGYFKELNDYRVNHALNSGFSNFIIFKYLKLENDISYLLQNGWKNGVVFERVKENETSKYMLLFLPNANPKS